VIAAQIAVILALVVGFRWNRWLSLRRSQPA